TLHLSPRAVLSSLDLVLHFRPFSIPRKHYGNTIIRPSQRVNPLVTGLRPRLIERAWRPALLLPFLLGNPMGEIRDARRNLLAHDRPRWTHPPRRPVPKLQVITGEPGFNVFLRATNVPFFVNNQPVIVWALLCLGFVVHPSGFPPLSLPSRPAPS